MTNLTVNKNMGFKAIFEWFKLSFNCFAKQPLMLIAFVITVVFISVFINILFTIIAVIIAAVVSATPALGELITTAGALVGPLVNMLLLPLYMASFATIANNLEQGETVKYSKFFSKFFANGALIRLAYLIVLGLLLVFVLTITVDVIVYGNLTHGVSEMLENIGQIKRHGITLFVYAVLAIIWGSMIVFSPLICKFNPEIGAISAIKLSMQAYFSNFIVMLTFAIAIVLITLIAAIPFGLGLLVSMPVIYMATYFAYKTAFN
jgi:uncharacterized membrane protein